MSKYAPLQAFLADHSGELTLTRDEVWQLVPDMAPSAWADNRWWINDDPSHPHCRAWGDAGFTAYPDLAHERVTFRPKL